MPNSKIPHTNITDNLNLQRLRHNQLIDSVGDVSTLVTTSKNITGAVNEVAGKFTAADSSPAFAGNVTVGGKLRVVGDARMQGDVVVGGALRIGDADTDTVSFSADVTSNIIPDVDNSFDIGDSTKEWRHGFFDGTLNADRLLADSGTITGNLDVQGITTLDSTTIGGSLTVNDSAVFSGLIRASGGLVAASATLSGVTIVGNQRVADPYVVVNDGIAVNNANRPGLAVDRPGTDSAVVYFNENTDRWQAGLKTGPLDIIRETDSARLSGLSVGGIPSTFSNWNSAYTTSLTSILDADFSTNGLMKRTGSGSYSIVTDNSTNWDSAYITTQTAILDADFGSNGLMKRTGAGSYTIVPDNSSNWDTAFGYGNHASAGYVTPTSSDTLTNKRLVNVAMHEQDKIVDSDGNPRIVFSKTGTADNFLKIQTTGVGSDTVILSTNTQSGQNVDMELQCAGTGVVAIPTGNLRYAGTVVTATGAELNYNDITTLGNSEASKVVTANASGYVNLSSRATAASYHETVVTSTLGSNSTQDLDLNVANFFVHTVQSGGTTFTFSNPSAPIPGINIGGVTAFTVVIKQDGTGSNGVTWPATVDWPGGTAPSIASAANAVTVFTFVSYDNGSSYYGFLAGVDVK